MQISNYNLEAAANKFFEQGLRALEVSGHASLGLKGTNATVVDSRHNLGWFR